ncbi:MAG TPA: DUF4476 domain-containing protein [Niastella sp.]
MKKTCFHLLFITLALTAHAHTYDGRLSITNLSRQAVLIEVDGKQYPDCNNALTLHELTAGYHLVKVLVESTTPASLNKWQMIYSRNVYVKEGYYVDIVINRFGRALYDEQLITDNRYDDDRNDHNDRNDRDHRNDWDHRDDRRPGRYNAGPRPATDETFAAFLETIKRESFDDSRMAIARFFVDDNYFTASQAKQLAGMFSFESNKLEIAKYMYGKTTDRKNYFVVYNVFTFSKSKEELAEYIRNYK